MVKQRLRANEKTRPLADFFGRNMKNLDTSTREVEKGFCALRYCSFAEYCFSKRRNRGVLDAY